MGMVQTLIIFFAADHAIQKGGKVMIKNIRLAGIILFGLILVNVDWSVAGVDDILQKRR